MDAIIYIRWSSNEQGKGSSLVRQREDCRAHARRKGWTVIDELVDDGVSAFKGKHASQGQLARFVADVEAGAYPEGVILLTEKLDRLSREQVKKVFSWILRMTELGVVVATVDGDRTYEQNNFDMAAIIEVVVKAQLANEESEKKASRLSAAWAAKRNRLVAGEPVVLTRRAPAWLTVEGSPPAFVVIPERVAVVKRIFEDTVAGFGKHHIARDLNRAGVATFGRASGWHSSYIQKILTSPAVLGEFQPGQKPRGEQRRTVGTPIQGYYPAIIDANLHASAMRSMAARHRRVAGRGRRLVNLFAGMATCGSCGSKMTFRGKGLKRRANGTWVNEDYLICDSYQRGRGCGNGYHFNYKVWEDGILNPLMLDAFEDRHFASPTGIRPLEIELAERVRRRTADQASAATALSMAVKSGKAEPRDLWTLLIKDIDEHDVAIAALRARIVEARGAVSPEEHRRRIFALRDTLDDPDEEVRFRTRSRIMEALHELIEEMAFSSDPLLVEIRQRGGRLVTVNWEDWGGTSKGLAWTIAEMPTSPETAPPAAASAPGAKGGGKRKAPD